jgi:hypothetical protein
MSPLTTESIKFEFGIQDPMRHRKTKRQRKAQEGHIEEGKTTKLIKRHEKRQIKKNGKKELRKAQNQY